MVTPSPNRLLWRFIDAVVPTEWKSKQAKRIYDAIMPRERNGEWTSNAVVGSVQIATHKTTVPAMAEPSFGYRVPDAAISSMMQHHILALRAHADRLEGVMRAYGPETFRTQRVALQSPIHPFEAEPAILSVLQRPDVDEIWVHGVHFVRDASRAFVPANKE